MPLFSAAHSRAFALSLLLALSCPLWAETASKGNAAGIAQDIAHAGRLRLQAQRLAKLEQQLALGIQQKQAEQQIAQTRIEMDRTLGQLARYARNPVTERLYARSTALWQELRPELTGHPPGSSHLERINQLADELMLHAGKLGMRIESEAETPVGRLLDLSSRLNMLSQRLARLYLQRQSGDRSAGLLIDIEQARKEFSAGLKELDTAPENSSASREAIALAKNQWIFFDNALSQTGQGKPADNKALLHVVTSSERIAQVLEEASAQYLRDYQDNSRKPTPQGLVQ